MSFADIPDKSETSGDFKKTEWTRIAPGVTTRLRILDEHAVDTYKHFIPNQRISLACLGEDCPICKNNDRLVSEHPNTKPWDIPGFISRQHRYKVNVLNKTVVKISPNGSITFPTKGGFPTNDPATGELIANIDPTALNRVEVLERGPRLFEQFNMINQQVCDDVGNPLGIWNYDIVITASGSGPSMTTTVIPYPNQNDPVNIPEEDLYDLEDLDIVLEPDEFVRVMNGTALRDIFAARRATEEANSLIEDVSEVEVNDNLDAQERIASIFAS